MEFEKQNSELLIVRLEQVNQSEGQIVIEFDYADKGNCNKANGNLTTDSKMRKGYVELDRNGGCSPKFKDTITLSDSGNDFECLNLVLETRDVKLNVLDKFGLAPIHYCANVNRTHIAEMLISRGANVDLAGDIGCWRIPYLPAIYHALKTFHFNLLHLLLDHSKEAYRQIPLGGDGLGLVTYVPHAFKSYVYAIESICPYTFLLLQILRRVVNPDRLSNDNQEHQKDSFISAIKCFHILHEFGVPITQNVLELCANLLKGQEWIAPHLPEQKNKILFEFSNMVIWKGTHPSSLRCLSRKRIREHTVGNVSVLSGLLPLTVESYLKHEQCACHISVAT